MNPQRSEQLILSAARFKSKSFNKQSLPNFQKFQHVVRVTMKILKLCIIQTMILKLGQQIWKKMMNRIPLMMILLITKHFFQLNIFVLFNVRFLKFNVNVLMYSLACDAFNVNVLMYHFCQSRFNVNVLVQSYIELNLMLM